MIDPQPVNLFSVDLLPARIAVFLLTITGLLTLAHIIAMVIWYREWLPVDSWLPYSFFDLDEEEGFGTWFSSLLLLCAAAVSLLVSHLDKRSGGGLALWWRLLGAGFLMLSLDETVGFHETVNTVIEHTHWTSYGALIAVASALLFLPFLLRLPSRTRLLMVVAGAIFLGGAIGVEWATIWHEDNDLLDTLGYNLTTALEEGMEMSGMVLYLYAVLEHSAALLKSKALRFTVAAATQDGNA